MAAGGAGVEHCDAALSQLFQHTGDERYVELADMCVDRGVVNALVDGSKDDPLVGLHASTWADFYIGIYQLGLANGNQRYVEAALKTWEGVRARHMYITGGSDSGEFWQSRSDGWRLRETTHAEETACASLWLAFEQNLLHGTGDHVRMEFPMEQTLVHDTRIGMVRMAMQRGSVVYAATWSDDLPLRMSGEMPDCGGISSVDVWPYLPTVVASSVGHFAAEALTPVVPQASNNSGSRVKVQVVPFHGVTCGKYSVWLPVVQA